MINKSLAYWALSKDYNFKGLACSGPIYKKMESTEDRKINLFFDYGRNGLASFGMELTGFEMAIEDKVFYPATAKINNTRTFLVFTEKVAKPFVVHYGFILCPKGTLFSIERFPASPFRTDDWENKTNSNI